MEEYFLTYWEKYKNNPYCRKHCFISRKCGDDCFLRRIDHPCSAEYIDARACAGDCRNHDCEESFSKNVCRVSLGLLGTEEKKRLLNHTGITNQKFESYCALNVADSPLYGILYLHPFRSSSPQDSDFHLELMRKFEVINNFSNDEWKRRNEYSSSPPRFLHVMRCCLHLADAIRNHYEKRKATESTVNLETRSIPNVHTLIVDKDTTSTVIEKEEKWITSTEAAKIEGIKVETLKEYRSKKHRSKNVRSEDNRSNEDSYGRKWKKDGRHVLYLESSLKKIKKKQK